MLVEFLPLPPQSERFCITIFIINNYKHFSKKMKNSVKTQAILVEKMSKNEMVLVEGGIKIKVVHLNNGRKTKDKTVIRG